MSKRYQPISTDDIFVDTCLFFTEPENQQALVNPSFMKILLDRLEEEHRTIGEDLQWLLRLISIGAIFSTYRTFLLHPDLTDLLLRPLRYQTTSYRN
jgi:hypothetical protein